MGLYSVIIEYKRLVFVLKIYYLEVEINYYTFISKSSRELVHTGSASETGGDGFDPQVWHPKYAFDDYIFDPKAFPS